MVVRTIYKTIRSILFSTALLVVGIYVLTYIFISIPAFTSMVKDRTVKELSDFLGGKVEIERLRIYPFNEMTVDGLKVYDPQGNICLSVDRIGAGIKLWKLIYDHKIELSYGEIIGLNANIEQKEKEGPYNIDFIIKAFSSNEKKEKKHFELALRNVVIRKSGLNFKRPWLENQHIGEFNLSNIILKDLAADIIFPKISDEEINIDLRRISFNIADKLKIEKIGFKGSFSENNISVNGLSLEFPESNILIPELSIKKRPEENFLDVLKEGNHKLLIKDSFINPVDFAFLFKPLSNFDSSLPLSLDIDGNLKKINLKEFNFGSPEILWVNIKGSGNNLETIKDSKWEISDLNFIFGKNFFSEIENFIPQKIKDNINGWNRMGGIKGKAQIQGDMPVNSYYANLELASELFKIEAEGKIKKEKDFWNVEGDLEVLNFAVDEFISKVPVKNLTAQINTNAIIKGQQSEGFIELSIDDIDYKGRKYDDINVSIEKNKENFSGNIKSHNTLGDIQADFNGFLGKEEKSLSLKMELVDLNLSEILDLKKYNGYLLSSDINLDLEGWDLNNFRGDLGIKDFEFLSRSDPPKLKVKNLDVAVDLMSPIQTIEISSDFFDLSGEGAINIKEFPKDIKYLASSVFPAMIGTNESQTTGLSSEFEFEAMIKEDNKLTEFFNMPFKLLVPMTIDGSLNKNDNSASISISLPYILQGKDKLIYDSKIISDLNANSGILNTYIATNLPVKNGDLSLNVNLFAQNDIISTDIHWINTENSDFKGHLSLDTQIQKNQFTHKPEISIDVKPSVLQMGVNEWNVARCNIDFADKVLDIKGFKVWHDEQFVEINGLASSSYSDVLRVNLADIDVDYVFDMLQINYVTFGGTATGEIAGHALLSGDPVAETESFKIDDLSYNGAVIGDCLVSSRWNNDEKEIEINADISKNGVRRVLGTGGIWLKRDSLCFDIMARKVPVEFVQPFMAVFSSHVGGYASGDVKLLGNFHDIDMIGKIFADSVAVKLDYTNTVYHGSDSVYMYPGKIEIPHFRLYDKNGNSAMLTGELKHRYFHDPSFNFRLSDAENFLCYDTNAEINPDWYGVLYGTGSAFLTGLPGLVSISADMTVGYNSTFTFVLNDRQYALDYQFLTFSDRKKEEEEKNKNKLKEIDFKELLRKKITDEGNSLSKFTIDIRATLTPQTFFTLIMDPAAGDKITARGKGAMQMKYESDVDELMMYGKYEIEEGNYNFSLQDILWRDFKIKEGSYISFNGNPLAADLDISATYRVNTNLSDLDKSFSTDRDLNRTNVPVDAVLSVTGNMQSPEITFDIELPTLTQDVERKVKSIISTEDMMNRQIIYLLALNRFYTPEYMGATGNGGELAAVASSTISSQLQNMLGQLTDKFSVAPTFRSDKGDFSDIEVDVALSSRLLNNRLLINGNFGYRDRSTSSTTFVGDFDVEYLLSKNGNLRLKAYNHFNDQNYYLREALTTQGLGVVYKRDFDNWFTFLKRKKKEEPRVNKEEESTVEENVNQ